MAKTKIPVIENFSKSLLALIEEDKSNGLSYFERKNEVNQLLKAILKSNKRNIAIIGDTGTGRETLLKLLVEKLQKEKGGFLVDYQFYKIDLDSIIAGTKYRGQLEERVKAILNEIEKNTNVILCIKEYIDIGELNSVFLSLFRSSAKIIMIFTPEKAEEFFDKNKIISFFHTIRVIPPNNNQALEILKNNLKRYEKTYSIKISLNILKSILEYSNLYLLKEMQPSRSISLLEEICTSIEINRIEKLENIPSELQKNYDVKLFELEKIKADKESAIKSGNYEKAAMSRDSEIKLEKEVEVLKKSITKKLREKLIKVKEEDIQNSIHNLTGIDIKKIINKERVLIGSNEASSVEYSGLPQFEYLQTQSILNGDEIKIKTGKAFVLIPHNKEFDELFYHYIKPALESHGLTVLKADNIFKPGNILSQVWAQIRTAEVILADVSGQNSNVIFEIGLCYGLQRCPILLTRNPSELPFNIRNLRYIQYENSISGAHKLAEQLKTSVGEFLSAVRSNNY